MKIAFTPHAQDCHSTVDSRFGRVIYDEEKSAWTTAPYQTMDQLNKLSKDDCQIKAIW
ncbi:MAG: hypothetical protein ABFC84_07770 [Veillonellales bacterium]